jgi:drug/metabolite transporter (DMT)-like permease
MNDLVFRLYARKSRSRGLYVTVIGVVWTLVFATPLLSGGRSISHATMVWGILSGLFSVLANILLIEGMSHNDAGMCSTIYRLNLVAVVLGAYLLLGEELSSLKLAGIVFAVIAIFMFFADSRDGGAAKGSKLGLCLVAGGALLRAGMGLSYKHALTIGADRSGILFLNGVLWIVGGGAYFLFRERKKIDAPLKKISGYGALSGVLICGIVFFMATALQYGDAAIVIPLAQMSFLGTSALGVLFLKERLTPKKSIGIIAGLACILLMSISTL